MKTKRKESFIKELIYGILIILSIYAISLIFWKEIVNFLRQLPVINSIYKLIVLEIERRSVVGLGIMTFLGSLFFISYPAEVLFLLYLKVGYNSFYISSIMIFYTMLGQIANYAVGFFIEKKILHEFVKNKKKEFLSTLKKYDHLFIIILNILPLPADILSVLLGMVKYDFRKAFLYTLIGKVLKFAFIGLLVFIVREFLF